MSGCRWLCLLGTSGLFSDSVDSQVSMWTAPLGTPWHDANRVFSDTNWHCHKPCHKLPLCRIFSNLLELSLLSPPASEDGMATACSLALSSAAPTAPVVALVMVALVMVALVMVALVIRAWSSCCSAAPSALKGSGRSKNGSGRSVEGGGRSRKDSQKTVEGQGKAVKGSGRSRKRSGKVEERQWKVKDRQ